MRSRSGSRSSSCGDHLPALPHHGAVLNQEGPKPTKEQKPRGLREKAKESRAGDGAISLFAPAPARRDARLGEGRRGQTLLAPASKLNRRRSPERAERDYVARSPRNGLPTPRPDQQKSTRGFQISASSQHCPPRDTSKNLTGSAPTRQDGSPRTPPIPLSLYLAHLHPLSTPHRLHLCQVLHCGIEPRLVLGQHGCGQWGKKKKKKSISAQTATSAAAGRKPHLVVPSLTSSKAGTGQPGCYRSTWDHARDTQCPFPHIQPRHLLVPLQHQDELSALGHHGHLCPGRYRHLRRNQRRDGVRKDRAQDAARLYYCRTYCSVSNTEGSGYNGF